MSTNIILFSTFLRILGHSVDLIYPYFLKFARQLYPHLECMDELRSLSDLTKPHNWYPNARAINRKIILHTGPPNSGKTYEALECFKQATSGLYLGPLRLLASEIYAKMNAQGNFF